MMTFDNLLSTDEQALAISIFQILEKAHQAESLMKKLEYLDMLYQITASDYHKKILEGLILKV